MGHMINQERSYQLLQQKLDQQLTGAPDSPVLIKILKILFSPEDAELARQLSIMVTPLWKLSQRLGIPQDELQGRLHELALKGLVFDIEKNGKWYYTLAPIVIGFFELTFMRTDTSLPLPELALLFDEYMNNNDRFYQAAFKGETQIGRAFPYEEALFTDDHSEILDWERASFFITHAKSIAVSVCACRHHALHLNKACNAPPENCLSFNYSADIMIRNGFAKPVTTARAMELLVEAKEWGLVQTGENVQKQISFMCNCCSCCCGMIRAIKTFNIRNAIVTSGWIMSADEQACKRCGKCEIACPVHAITREVMSDGKRGFPVCDATLCIGCGVCYSACKFNAIRLKSVEKRVYPPETVFERLIAMAIERGKLADLIFEDPEQLSHKALAKIVKTIENSTLYRKALSNQSVKSAYLRLLVSGARKQSGPITEKIDN